MHTAGMACELCGRDIATTKHHLFPREVEKKRAKRLQRLDTADLCFACHSFIHSQWTNKELQHSMHSIELLLEEEKVQNWLTFISGKPPDFNQSSKMSNERRR